jgi:hypothetical protein
MDTRRALVIVFAVLVLPSCRGDDFSPNVVDEAVGGPARLVLSADVTTGSVPLTVNFTGTLYGRIDTLFTTVPEITFNGGSTQPEALYYPLPDTLTGARRTYGAREHYFRNDTYRAVMIVHGRYRTIVSDTLVITVR